MQNEWRNSKRYMNNFAALYGEGKIKEKALPIEADESEPSTPKEAVEQIRFIRWLKKAGLLYFAIPNGSNRSIAHRLSLRAQGLIAGVPDVLICEPVILTASSATRFDGVPGMPRLAFHGLFIEMKRTKGGILRPEQKEFMAKLTAKGYFCMVAYGCDDAILITEKYLGMST